MGGIKIISEETVLQKIREYNPEGRLGHTAELFLSLSLVKHPQVKDHLMRVALLSEEVARRQEKDASYRPNNSC